MNPVLSNALQDPLWGDVQTLLFLGQMIGLQYSHASVLVARRRGYDVRDCTCFAIPATWWPFHMMLGQPLFARDLNIDADVFCFVASRCGPNGSSSVGIARRVARKLATVPRATRGLDYWAASEIRKDMSLPGASATAQEPTWQVHFDNFAAQRPF